MATRRALVLVSALALISLRCANGEFAGGARDKGADATKATPVTVDLTTPKDEPKKPETYVPGGLPTADVTDCTTSDASIVECTKTGEIIGKKPGKATVVVTDKKGNKITVNVTVTDIVDTATGKDKDGKGKDDGKDAKDGKDETDEAGKEGKNVDKDGKEGKDEEPDVEDELLNGPEIVRNVTASLKYDGRIRFCVDFKTGTIILDEIANRLGNSPAEVVFQVKKNGGVTPYTFRLPKTTPGTEKLPGNWKFVKGLNVNPGPMTRCTDPRKSTPSSLNTTVSGTQVCFDGDDSQKDQSGLACYLQMDWNLKTSAD